MYFKTSDRYNTFNNVILDIGLSSFDTVMFSVHLLTHGTRNERVALFHTYKHLAHYRQEVLCSYIDFVMDTCSNHHHYHELYFKQSP